MDNCQVKTGFLDYFEETVVAKRDEIAVVHKESSISFGKLRRKAVYLGNELAKVVPGVMNRPVAVFMPKCIDAVVANIAIMYAGNVFMNLDVKTPAERIHNILELIEPVAILTDEKSRALLPETDIGVRPREENANDL